MSTDLNLHGRNTVKSGRALENKQGQRRKQAGQRHRRTLGPWGSLRSSGLLLYASEILHNKMFFKINTETSRPKKSECTRFAKEDAQC